jgi:hypothetical protein
LDCLSSGDNKVEDVFSKDNFLFAGFGGGFVVVK